jgi:hypothetical protein
VLSFLRHQDKLAFIWTLPVPCVTHDIGVYQMSQVDLIRIDLCFVLVLSFLRHQDKLGFIWTLPVPCVTHDIGVYQMSQVDLIRIDF